MISVRRRWLLGAAVGLLAGTVAGVACGWMLATPEASSWVRALSVGTGSTVLGIAVLAAMIRGERRPGIEPDDVWRSIATSSGLPVCRIGPAPSHARCSGAVPTCTAKRLQAVQLQESPDGLGDLEIPLTPFGAVVLWLDGKRYVSPTFHLDVVDRIGGVELGQPERHHRCRLGLVDELLPALDGGGEDRRMSAEVASLDELTRLLLGL